MTAKEALAERKGALTKGELARHEWGRRESAKGGTWRGLQQAMNQLSERWPSVARYGLGRGLRGQINRESLR